MQMLGGTLTQALEAVVHRWWDGYVLVEVEGLCHD
jgi:hypothetical protein